jgi:hypothetical protein
MASSSPSPSKERVEARRLELSLNLEDGSLLTAPLSTVLLAATDGLYSDLYNMAHGELEVTRQNVEGMDPDAANATSSALKKEKMSNLSFAQRRHELAWRLAQHGKALTHVAALTAASASTEFSHHIKISTKALQHARTAWVQADEAQDALYFFHAQLFPARQAPHDIYGALDLLKRGAWYDLPTDLRLVMDRYEKSQENEWTASEVQERWHMAVRDKLIRGEVAWMRRMALQDPSLPEWLWKVSLDGGILKMTHGRPKQIGSQTLYPIEARLTVLSTTGAAEWALLSVEVGAQAKTGGSNHQLDITNRQRFDLHRLCAAAMTREENRAKEEDRQARPLECLFEVAHTFGLSWQLEILSAQAQAMRRGVWAAEGDSKSSILISPVQFFTDGSTIGSLSISFWTIDDKYGPPCMGDLVQRKSKKSEKAQSSPNQLTLTIRAEKNVGIEVSLSGGATILEESKTQVHVKNAVERLVEAASNPFTLSASNALLAATILCAEQKCRAVVDALRCDADSPLPLWLHLSVDRGSVAVATRVRCATSESIDFIPLFRLGCDSRTGNFVSTFDRSFGLLRLLACNEVTASDATALRAAELAQHRRRGGAVVTTGRHVRDTFEGLSRSMNVLGQKAGVGKLWEDKDSKSEQLRQRAIQLACKDVRVSLMTSCGMAALYGLSALALGVATGVTAVADNAGGPVEVMGGITFVAVPPVAVILDQQMIQRTSNSSDGDWKKQALLEKELFALSCSVNDVALTIHALDVTVVVDSPASLPSREKCSLVPLKEPFEGANGGMNGEPAPKRAKIENGAVHVEDNNDVLMEEVETLAKIFTSAL